ncbi:MAG TPA: ATP-binding protein, partial [Herpetosiphonaceae bacterium]
NTGHATQISSPLALLACAIILAFSSSDQFARQPWLLRHWRWWLALGVALWLAYAGYMLFYVPAASADHAAHGVAPTLQERVRALGRESSLPIAWINIGLYLATALVYGRRWNIQPTRALAALTCGSLLLAGTALTVQYGVLGRFSFWLYHIILLAAVITITSGIMAGYERSGSLSGAVDGLLLHATVERQQQAFKDGMAALLAALERGDVALIPALRHDLRQRFGLADDQLDLLEHTVHVVADEREEQRRLRSMVSLSRAATLNLDPDVLLRNAIETLARDSDAALWAIGLAEAEALVFRPQHRALGGQLAQREVRLPLTLVPAAWLADDEPAQRLLDANLPQLAGAPGPALLVPMIHHGQLIGVLAHQPAPGEPIDDQTVTICQSMGAHLATALANARLYRELEQKHERLLHSEQAKEQLTQMVVHDLKNPLTAVMSYVEMLDRLGPSPEQGEMIEGARRSSQAMLRLINDILDIARLEEGRLELHTQPQPLHTLLQASADELRFWADQELMSLAVQPGAADILLEIDPGLIRRVLINLISNAIKHTPPRTAITIGATLTAGDCQLWVRDNGPGVPLERQDQLFERFSAGGTGGERQSSTGLGLHFCKLAVEAHGGHMSVQSAPGLGATFTVHLPASRIIRQETALS